MAEVTQRSKGRKEVGVIWVTAFYTVFLTALIVLDDLGKLSFLVRLMHNFPFGDKFVHFFLIGMLSFLVNRSVMQLSTGQNPKRILMIVTSILLAAFTFEESSQSLFAERRASLFDLMASYAGIVTFALLAFQTWKKSNGTLPVKPSG